MDEDIAALTFASNADHFRGVRLAAAANASHLCAVAAIRSRMLHKALAQSVVPKNILATSSIGASAGSKVIEFNRAVF